MLALVLGVAIYSMYKGEVFFLLGYNMEITIGYYYDLQSLEDALS